MLKKLALGCVVSVALLYAVYYFVALHRFDAQLRNAGYKQAKIQGFVPYLDGVVIRDLRAGSFHFSNLYLAGGPHRHAFDKASYLSADKLDIDVNNLFSGAVQWPLPTDIPLTINHVAFNKNILGRDIRFAGKIKQDPGTPLLFDFTTESSDAEITCQAEIRIKDGLFTSVDLEFADASIKLPLLDVRRSMGWVSWLYNQSWNVIGEIESGFVSLGHHTLGDTALKLNGDTKTPDFSFGGMDNKATNSWVFDRENSALLIRHGQLSKQVQWLGLNKSMLVTMAGVMDSFMIQDSPEPVPVKKTAGKPYGQPLKEAETPAEKSIAVANEKVTDESMPVLGTVVFAQKSFAELVAGSLFADFQYSKNLTYVGRECVDNASSNCWTAQAVGGHFGYNSEMIPAYFLRQQDYEQSKLFRKVLQSFNVQSIKLTGNAQMIQTLTLNGTGPDGQPAYIELFVEGAE